MCVGGGGGGDGVADSRFFDFLYNAISTWLDVKETLLKNLHTNIGHFARLFLNVNLEKQFYFFPVIFFLKQLPFKLTLESNCVLRQHN